MVFMPRQAAPGALRRWSLQAFRLISRGLGVWLGLIVLLCLAIFAGQRLPLVSGVLALMAYFGSILVAARVDQSDAASFTDAGHAAPEWPQPCRFFGCRSPAGALVWMLFLARPDVPWWNVLYTERNVVTALSETGSSHYGRCSSTRPTRWAAVLWIEHSGTDLVPAIPVHDAPGVAVPCRLPGRAAGQMRIWDRCWVSACCSYCCRSSPSAAATGGAMLYCYLGLSPMSASGKYSLAS